MNTKSFKDFLSTSGPDKPKTPAKSRAQRRAEAAPRVAAEALEERRLFASVSLVGGVLIVTGTSGAERIDVYANPSDNDWIYVDAQSPFQQFGPYNPANITKTQVYGLGGNDSLFVWEDYPYALPFPGEVYGGDGDDWLGQGTGHNDTLYGGAGNDTVVGSGGNDLVYGDDGDDSLQGGAGADTIYGGIGYDTVSGGDGNDLIFGGTGSGADSDSVTGYDSLLGDGGNDYIYGEGGGDTIRGGDGADYLSGGDYNDSIFGGEGVDSMYGNDGDDTLNATDGDNATDILNGGNGNDCGWWDVGEDSDTEMEGNFN